MMSIRLNELKYVLFPGENPRLDWGRAYRETYKTWRIVWSETFKELDNNGTLYSDDFTRQTMIGSILWNEQCLGLAGFHFVDFNHPTAKDDSWFRCWPPEALESLTADGTRVLIGTNVTVHPDFRGTLRSGLRLRNILLGLMCKTLQGSHADVLAGTMRMNKGMDRAVFLPGVVRVGQSTLHGTDVALFAVPRLKTQKHVFELAVESLWRTRLIYSDLIEAPAEAA